ncbi:hypothetical protein OUZ56_007005 [Daphnia magna]|uniref:Uncharacterized protein n=1 Tax=Daphnia magna TaxID=35525 RepID=A0ABQ9YXB4_9CRUS|nr:hypothetical protein OUZ56_007005 [Daphnia magna]
MFLAIKKKYFLFDNVSLQILNLASYRPELAPSDSAAPCGDLMHYNTKRYAFPAKIRLVQHFRRERGSRKVTPGVQE